MYGEMTDEVQFTVDHTGKITAVVVPPELWRRVIEALEDAEDRSIVESLRDRLVKGPALAGALRWEDVGNEWQ
ncbi:MAG: hypothetical protein GXP42_05715 [Chloroflexi bacterium]|nr:hypothetical protein [Chloroflexota bacterium]